MPRIKTLDGFKFHQAMMSFSGVWPYESPSAAYRIRTLTSWFLSLSVCSCMLVDAVYEGKDFTKLSEIFYILITWLVYILKLWVFRSNKAAFLELVAFFSDPVFSSYPEELDGIVEGSIRVTTLMAKVIFIMYGSCVLLYLVYPMLDNLPLPFPFPYDLGNFRLLMYAFQLVGEACAAWNNACLDTMCTGFMGMVATHLDILCERIKRNKSGDVETLKECVVHHNAIIRVVEMIEEVFTVGLLAQFIASVLTFCNTLFQFLWVTLSWQFLLLGIYFFAMLSQLFMYCWFGNEILLKSKEVGTACYMSEWTDYDARARQYLFIMMERAKRPLVVTTMKLSALSLSAFASILQWSYSCLALLLNIYDKRESN